MKPEQAYEIIYQLARAASVNGEVGDKRDEALKIAKKLMVSKKDKKDD